MSDPSPTTTSLPVPEVDPSIYTLGVEKGDTQLYNLTKAFHLDTSRFFIDEVGFEIRLGQEFLVEISDITESSFTYDILVKLSTGALRLEKTKYFNLKHPFSLVNTFVTTTNSSYIQNRLRSSDLYNFSMQGNILSVTETFYDSGWNVPVVNNWVFDLKTGWLMSLYVKAANDTYLLKEYEIINSRNDQWLKQEMGLLITFMPFSSWLSLSFLFLFIYRRRKK